jgi:ABC-type amino acid transport substrate-binding protein
MRRSGVRADGGDGAMRSVRGALRMLAAILAALVLAWEPPARAQAPDVLGAVRARGEVRVCIWPDYLAISYRNPRNNQLEGIDIDLAREFAARLGVRLGFVETNFRDFMDRLEQRDCDVAMFGVGITPQRVARVDFSAPYLASAVYAVTTRDNRLIRGWADLDRPGNSIAVAAGTFMEPLMRQTLRHATLDVVATPRSREAEVQAGRADAFMSDFPYTRRMVLLHDWARIIEPPDRFGETPYAFAVPKGEAAWLAVVNEFVAAIRADGTLARAAERHGLTPILLR